MPRENLSIPAGGPMGKDTYPSLGMNKSTLDDDSIVHGPLCRVEPLPLP